MKPQAAYVCSACGASTKKWLGQCPDCGDWNTLVETRTETPATGRRPAGRRVGYAGVEPSELALLSDIEAGRTPRFGSGIGELDRVLGGGWVPGSTVLLGGDPGVGKSTLILQAAAHAVRAGNEVVYVSGEESPAQLAMRAARLELGNLGIRVLTETEIERIAATLQRARPRLVIVDSIQTLYAEALTSVPGSVAQVRECAAQLVRFAKASSATLVMIGHVTKEGSIAGPRVLEHMVDAVLYFEGEKGERFRVVRAAKNRFGAVNELGVFAMTDRGLAQIDNPSAIFLSQRALDTPGSGILVTREGTRPLLVEIQALVDLSSLSNPRRVTVGLDQNRLAMLVAVLQRHCGLTLSDQDLFVNAVGGVRLSETGADLAVASVLVSSLRERPVPGELVIFGEVGLAGEVRPVQSGPERLAEAAKHGFTRAVVPEENAPKRGVPGIEIRTVRRLADALEAVLG